MKLSVGGTYDNKKGWINCQTAKSSRDEIVEAKSRDRESRGLGKTVEENAYRSNIQNFGVSMYICRI